MSSNIKGNFSRCSSFHFPIKEVKNKKHKQLRCEKTPLKKYRPTYTLGRPPSPCTFPHIFGVPPLYSSIKAYVLFEWPQEFEHIF